MLSQYQNLSYWKVFIKYYITLNNNLLEYRTMDKKNMYIEAIQNCDLYTNKQRSILSTLVKVAIDEVATISPRNLSEISGATQPVVYKAIRLFEKEKLIQSLNTANNKRGVFKLLIPKLDEIEEIYKKTKKLKNK